MTEPESARNVREIMKGPPSGYLVVVAEREDDGADELASFGAELLAAWKWLLAASVLAGVFAGGSAFLMLPKFRAQALVAPVSQTGASVGGGALRQLGGIAALAGIDITTSGGRKDEYLATLTSQGFARDFISAQHLVPVLYPERWDAQAQHWRPGVHVPTLGDAVKRFTNDVVAITDDKKTGFVTLTVDWYSPQLAADWANGMIEMVNERLRDNAIHDAQSSLEYLDKELAKTNVVEIRQAIYRLTEQQVNNAMLANVQREYAYRFLDKAVAPERKYSPKRSVSAAVGAAMGLFVGVLLVYLRRAFRRGPATAGGATKAAA